jgi:hypothetical protein
MRENKKKYHAAGVIEDAEGKKRIVPPWQRHSRENSL